MALGDQSPKEIGERDKDRKEREEEEEERALCISRSDRKPGGSMEQRG